MGYSFLTHMHSEMKVSTAGEKLDIVGYTEILVRQLLSNRPDNAVMMLSSFGSDKPFGNAAHLHNVVSEYYVSVAQCSCCCSCRPSK